MKGVAARAAEHEVRPCRVEAGLWMLGASAAFAAVEGLGRLVPREHSPYQLVFVRYAVHLGLMLVVLGPRLGLTLVRTRRPAVQVIRSLLMLGMPACFIGAMARMRGNEVWAVFWIAPLVAALGAAAAGGGRVPLRRWMALLVGLAGAVVSWRPGIPAPGVGMLLAAGMAACFAAYLVLTRALRSEPATTNVFYTALGVFLALGAVAPAFWTPLTARAFAPMAAVGIVGFGGLYALDKALAGASVPAAAPLLYSQTAFALPVAVLAGDGIGRSAMAGAALVAASITLYALAETRERRSVS